MDTTTPRYIIICYLLLIPFLSNAEIKNGYWMGFSLTKNHQEATVPQFEEWVFEDDVVTINKITRSLTVNWTIKDDNIVLSQKKWDKDLLLGLESSGDMLTLNSGDTLNDVYLFYIGKKRKFSSSNAKAFITNQLFEIDRPDLLYNSNEIEFWDSAFFYKSGVSTCVHNYGIIEVGKYTFIFFNNLIPLRVLTYDKQKIVCEKIDNHQKIVFSKKEIEKKLDPKLFSGKWKWKSSGKKPNMDTYTINIGFQMHELVIKDDSLIDWFTIDESYYGIDTITVVNSPIIPEFIYSARIDYRSNMFLMPRARKYNEIPHIEFSPSGRIIQLESYPMKREGRGEEVAHGRPLEYYQSDILTLQYINHTEDRIYLKYSNQPFYVTLIRVE